MRIIVAALAFGITLGGLFLFENYKAIPNEENYAQIVQELIDKNQGKTLSPKLIRKANKTPPATPALSPISSSTVLPSATPPIVSLTPYTIPAQQAAPTPTPFLSPSIEPLLSSTTTPTPQPTQQKEQITVLSLTSPVKQNSTAQLDIKTAPMSLCAITVTLPSGSQSTAKGLENKTADDSGLINWSWKINWNTKPGIANIDLTCSKDGLVISKSLQMTITE